MSSSCKTLYRKAVPITFPFTNQWRPLKNEALAGLTVSLAMVPEVVAFAFVAGVNPLVGLYAAFVAGLIAALSILPLCRRRADGGNPNHRRLRRVGPLYPSGPATGHAGICERPGDCDFLAQLRHFQGLSGMAMAALTALTDALTFLLPRVSRALPSSLAAILLVTVLAHLAHLPVRNVGDLAVLHGVFPQWAWPAVPMTWKTLKIILPFSVVLVRTTVNVLGREWATLPPAFSAAWAAAR